MHLSKITNLLYIIVISTILLRKIFSNISIILRFLKQLTIVSHFTLFHDRYIYKISYIIKVSTTKIEMHILHNVHLDYSIHHTRL